VSADDELRRVEPERPRSYLTPETGPKALRLFFEQTAAFYRARPWEMVMGWDMPLGFTFEELGVREASLVLRARQKKPLELLVFWSNASLELGMELEEYLDEPAPFDCLDHLSLRFERRSEVSGEFGREVDEHGFELATKNLLPQLLVTDELWDVRAPRLRELVIATAAVGALAAAIRVRAELEEVTLKRASAAWRFDVTTQLGRLPVRLATRPCDGEYGSLRTRELLKELFEWEEIRELDCPECREIERDLLRHFEESLEGQGVSARSSLNWLMRAAALEFEVSIARLARAQFEELVFVRLPHARTLSLDQLSELLTALRAFARFLARSGGHAEAESWLLCLGNDAEARLRAALEARGGPPSDRRPRPRGTRQVILQ